MSRQISLSQAFRGMKNPLKIGLLLYSKMSIIFRVDVQGVSVNK
jgi:hypothetical protein